MLKLSIYDVALAKEVTMPVVETVGPLTEPLQAPLPGTAGNAVLRKSGALPAPQLE